MQCPSPDEATDRSSGLDAALAGNLDQEALWDAAAVSAVLHDSHGLDIAVQ